MVRTLLFVIAMASDVPPLFLVPGGRSMAIGTLDESRAQSRSAAVANAQKI